MTFAVSWSWWFGGAPSDGGASGHLRAHRDESIRPADPTTPTNDLVLAAQLRQGDAHALEQLVRTYATSLEAHAFTVVRADDVARDVVQEVFIRLWDQRAQLQLRGSFSAYLHRAVHFAAVSALRHELTERRATAVHAAAARHIDVNTAVADVEQAELERVVRDAIEKLPPRCREVLLLQRQAGMSYAQIADALHIAPQTVANQMHRALRALAEAVRRWQSGD